MVEPGHHAVPQLMRLSPYNRYFKREGRTAKCVLLLMYKKTIISSFLKIEANINGRYTVS
jgi:hypothetical protein